MLNLQWDENVFLISYAFTLKGIEPVNKDWTTEDSRRFQRLVEYREFVSAVMDRKTGEDGSAKLSLVLVDTGNPKVDVYIDQILVEEGRAVRKNVVGVWGKGEEVVSMER